jgi:RNA polymerase sporulation-specific sigma factor
LAAPRSYLTTLADTELAARAQDGDPRALELLLARYRWFGRAKTRGYFIVGADADDLEQEALIGLLKAVRDFRPEHLVRFRTFAELCVTRQVITAIKAATRQKHQPLNHYVSTSASWSGGDGDEWDDEWLVALDTDDPADRVVEAEGIASLQSLLAGCLSPFETDVLHLYADSVSYGEIGTRLGRSVKSVDNAVQRIKRKLDHHSRDLIDDGTDDGLALTA